jgi:hypothetical protein
MDLVRDAQQLITDIRGQTEGEQVAAIVKLDTLWREFACAVIVAHHCTYDGSRQPGRRG